MYRKSTIFPCKTLANRTSPRPSIINNQPQQSCKQQIAHLHNRYQPTSSTVPNDSPSNRNPPPNQPSPAQPATPSKLLSTLSPRNPLSLSRLHIRQHPTLTPNLPANRTVRPWRSKPNHSSCPIVAEKTRPLDSSHSKLLPKLPTKTRRVAIGKRKQALRSYSALARGRVASSSKHRLSSLPREDEGGGNLLWVGQ
jgi:hypothetical protein